MTHGEIEKKAFEVFPKPNRCDYPNDDEYGNAIIVRSIQREGYIKALKEIESLPKVKGYVATDRFGTCFYTHKPYRVPHLEMWFIRKGGVLHLPIDKSKTINDEPVEVEFLIREV